MSSMSILLFSALLMLPLPALKFDAPAGWVSQKPGSTSRVAEFMLPKADGDTEDAMLIVFYFGANMGGDVKTYIERWTGQMSQPDGRKSADVAKISTLTANSLKITLVDISGTYVAEMSPGSADHYNKPGFRLVNALVETSEGPYFVRL